MRITSQRHEEPEINLVPLIDVLLVLLIFFMATTTFIHASGLRVSLPQSEQATPTQDARVVEVVVDADGRYYVDGRQLRDRSALTLERGLREVSHDDRSRPLVIRADGRASHQAVVTVMDVAGRIGFNQLSIATSRPE